MSSIVYFEDIVKEISKETGISEAELTELYKSSIKYTHKLMEDPKVISISIRGLGVLHFNYRAAAPKLQVNSMSTSLQRLIEPKLKLIEEAAKDNKKLVHKRNSLFSKFRKYFYPDRKKRVRAKRLDVLKKIELKQNKL